MNLFACLWPISGSGVFFCPIEDRALKICTGSAAGQPAQRACPFAAYEEEFKAYEYRLRGPAEILFISRDTCSDSIAKSFYACFYGVSHNYRAIRSKMAGVSHRYACIKLSPKGGVAPFWGSANLPEKASHDIVLQYRAIWGD